MPIRGPELITRHSIANLLIGRHAPTSKEGITDVYEQFNFHPPEDFVLTPFDYLILSQFSEFAGLTLQVSTDQLITVIESSFRRLRYEVRVTKCDIHNYFKVLRGDIPGIPLMQGEGKATSANLPSIRDRYNILHAIRLVEENYGRNQLGRVLPDYKRDLQYLVAVRYINDFSSLQIIEELGFPYPHLIIDMMILDILEIDNHYSRSGEDMLREELQKVIQAYIHLCPKSKIVDEYADHINRGKYLFPATHALAKFVNQAVSELWLNILMSGSRGDKTNPMANPIFRALEMKYIKLITRRFIKEGSGGANKWIKLHYGKLGFRSVQLGSFIVSIACGLPTANFQYADIIEKGFMD